MTNLAHKQNATFADHFFGDTLAQADPAIAATERAEWERLQNSVELIASENIVSRAVREANGSVFTCKYAEGYPGKRYYAGCENADVAEQLAIDRACQLFDCKYANVQPHSGASANAAVLLALLQPHDTILGMSLAHGGHLTHGAAPALSGKWFNAIQYGLNAQGLLDYDQMEALAREHKPKLIICGASAYARVIDWARFRKVADEVGAYLMADMAHYAGLVAGGAYPSPLPYADIVTTTTHKTLRGPSGGMILSNREDLFKKIDSAVFPGLQGKPLSHVVAAKAVAFAEALRPDFKIYAQDVITNARALAAVLVEGGLDIVSGGTDSHIVLVDLRPKGLTGKAAEEALHRASLTCNKNAVPNDPQKPMITSGVRLGTPASTTRGFGVAEFQEVGRLVLQVLDGLVAHGPEGNASVESQVREKVLTLCARFPVYQNL